MQQHVGNLMQAKSFAWHAWHSLQIIAHLSAGRVGCPLHLNYFFPARPEGNVSVHPNMHVMLRPTRLALLTCPSQMAQKTGREREQRAAVYKGILDTSGQTFTRLTKSLADGRMGMVQSTMKAMQKGELVTWDPDQVIGLAMNQVNFVSSMRRRGA